MKYQNKSAISYMFRNFWHLAPMCVVAAILLGMFCNTNAEIIFVRNFAEGTINGENILKAVLHTVSVTRFNKYWWGLLISIVWFALSESIMMVKVERHMRVGEMLPFPIKRTFAAFPSVLTFVFGSAVLIELLNLVVAGVAFLIRAAGPTAIAIVTGVLIYLTRVLVMLVVGALMLVFPIMGLENYSFNNALSYSVRLMAEKKKYLAILATLYPLTRLLLTVVCGFVNVYFVTVVVFSVFYLFAAMAIPSVTFQLYYDSVGGVRRDLSVVMFNK